MLYQPQSGQASGVSVALDKRYYLGIDQHAKQLTICLRNAAGEQIQRGQVSTKWEKVRGFFKDLGRRCGCEAGGGYVAIVEVCGFNDWLLELLREQGCLEVVLVQPEKKSKHKSDRRDAFQLAEVLWLNRDRLATGQRLAGIRRVHIPSAADGQDRRLTGMRVSAGRELTRTINRVKHLLRRRNLQQECPTKGIQTAKARAWLKRLALDELDRMELDGLLERWGMLESQIAQLDRKIGERARQRPECAVIQTIPGAGPYTALALACRIGPIERFPRGSSLANFFGLAPSLNDSGESTGRVGSITKRGSLVARFLLGQLVLHVLKKDPRMRAWHKGIKRRRGAKTSRVAVMRRLACILGGMLRTGEAYRLGPPAPSGRGPKGPAVASVKPAKRRRGGRKPKATRRS